MIYDLSCCLAAFRLAISIFARLIKAALRFEELEPIFVVLKAGLENLIFKFDRVKVCLIGRLPLGRLGLDTGLLSKWIVSVSTRLILGLYTFKYEVVSLQILVGSLRASFLPENVVMIAHLSRLSWSFFLYNFVAPAGLYFYRLRAAEGAF